MNDDYAAVLLAGLWYKRSLEQPAPKGNAHETLRRIGPLSSNMRVLTA
ncbi:MAG: hypothetical protein KDB01_18380 [Planctomycetaceae bacterium]|nr:hypothetical protein [Planctomycetaceae bacterium]